MVIMDKKIAKKFVLYSLVIIICGLFFFPIFYVYMESFKPQIELFSTEFSLLPRTFSLEHYQLAFKYRNFFNYLKNSIIVTLLTVLLTDLVVIFASYAISRFDFPGRGSIRHVILLAYMIPGILLAIPLYLIFSRTPLFNSRFSLVISYMAFTTPFSVWFLTAYFDSLPIEIEEAALIDGASRTRILLEIVFPVALPGIVAISIFNFITSWNDFTFANTLLTLDTAKTLPVGMSLFFEDALVNWGALFATSTLATIPSIIFVAIAHQGLIKGIAAGAVKK